MPVRSATIQIRVTYCLKTAVNIIKFCAYQIANEQSDQKLSLGNLPIDKNLASDEYLNIESKYYRKILMGI